ncbi:unnamed protein product [Lampetra planeri]
MKHSREEDDPPRKETERRDRPVRRPRTASAQETAPHAARSSADARPIRHRGRRRATNLPPPILMARSDVVPSFGANLRGAARSLR